MPETTVFQDLGETALWVARYRAIESARPDALFRDPYADRLAGERGRELVDAMRQQAMYGWVAALRTRIVDDLVEREVAAGADAVLNLGAGLDTRPYRLKLPGELLWIEVDQPGVLQRKEEALRGERPACRLERLSVDLTRAEDRRACFAGVDARARRVVVLTEGVILYLTNEEVGALADDLRACARFSAWITEHFDPKLGARLDRRSGRKEKMKNVPFRFKPEAWEPFFAAHGWTTREVRHHGVEGEALGRPMPLPWLIRALLPRKRLDALRRMMGYAVLVPSGG